MNVNMILVLKKMLIPIEETSAITFDRHHNLHKDAMIIKNKMRAFFVCMETSSKRIHINHIYN
jgi:hypothetical protein